MKKWLRILLVVVVLIIIGIGIYLIKNYWHFGDEKNEPPLIGGCAGVHIDYRQECCDNWAAENNIVHIQCAGEWVIEDNKCKWECS